jgi:hypothetical protein
MIKELWDSFVAYEQAATQSFLGTVIFVGIPAIILLLLYVGLFGSRQVPSDRCYACGQKLPKDKVKK